MKAASTAPLCGCASLNFAIRTFAFALSTAYHNRAIPTMQVIEELIKPAKDLDAATRRGEDLGLTDDEVAFYDALAAKNSAVQAMGDDKLKVIAAELITQRRADAPFLVEKQVGGVELRVFMTRTGRYAAVRRTPASVVGDGKSSIAELAARETERRMNPRTNCLGPLIIDAAAERWLARSGYNRFTIPFNGIEVPLLGHVDALGAYSVDVTDHVHEGLAALCLRTVEQFRNVPYLGIDLVCTAPDAALPARIGV